MGWSEKPERHVHPYAQGDKRRRIGLQHELFTIKGQREVPL